MSIDKEKLKSEQELLKLCTDYSTATEFSVYARKKLCYVIYINKNGREKASWYYLSGDEWKEDVLGFRQGVLGDFIRSKLKEHEGKPTEKDVALYKHYKSYISRKPRALFNALKKRGHKGKSVIVVYSSAR